MDGAFDALNKISGAPLGVAVLVLVLFAVLRGLLYTRAAVLDMRRGFEERLAEARTDRDYYREIALRSTGLAERTVATVENVVPLRPANGAGG